MNGSRLLGFTVTSALAVVLSVLAVPAAYADEPLTGPVATPVDGTAPVTLAATGLNLAVPLLLGLGALVAGIALIGWGMLRRRPQQH